MDMLMDENMEKFSEKLKDLLALAKKKLGLEQSLYTISQTLGFVLFEKVPINQLFNKNQNSVSTDEYPNLFSIN